MKAFSWFIKNGKRLESRARGQTVSRQTGSAWNLATEIKIQAGRRAGELLQTANRHRVGQAKKKGCKPTTILLDDLAANGQSGDQWKSGDTP
jgi:hypothetical protein